MDMIKKIFPYSFGAKDAIGLVIKIVVYLVVGAVCDALIGILAAVPVINILVGLVCGVIDLYVLVGIILAVLDFLKVLK